MTDQLTHPRCGHPFDRHGNHSTTRLNHQTGARHIISQGIALLCPACMKDKLKDFNKKYWRLRRSVEVNQNFWLALRHEDPYDDESMQQGIVKARLAKIEALKERLISVRREKWYETEREMLGFETAEEKAVNDEEMTNVAWDVGAETIWRSDIAEYLEPADESSEDEESEWEGPEPE